MHRAAAHRLRDRDLRAAGGGRARRHGRVATSCPTSTKARCGCRCRCRPGLRSTRRATWRAICGASILKFPEVSYVVTQTGRNDDGTDPWTMSHIEAPVGLKPYDTWPGGESKKEFLDKLATTLARDLPGYSIGISQPIIDGVNDMIGGAHSPLVIKVFGDDLPMLRRRGPADGGRALHHPRHLQRLDLPGAADPADQHQGRSREGGALWASTSPTCRTSFRPASGRRRSRRSTSASASTTSRCASSPRAATARDARRTCRVHTSSGMQVPLSQVADIRVQSGESTITRENGQRNLTIRIDNRDRDLTSYLAEAQAKIAARVHFDPNQDAARMGRAVREPAPRRGAPAGDPRPGAWA